MDVRRLPVLLLVFLLIGSAIVVTAWRVFEVRSSKGKVITAILTFAMLILAIVLYGYFFVEI